MFLACQLCRKLWGCRVSAVDLGWSVDRVVVVCSGRKSVTALSNAIWMIVMMLLCVCVTWPSGTHSVWELLEIVNTWFDGGKAAAG